MQYFAALSTTHIIELKWEQANVSTAERTTLVDKLLYK